MDFSGLNTQIILPPFFVLTSGEKQMIRVTNSIKKYVIWRDALYKSK